MTICYVLVLGNSIIIYILNVFMIKKVLFKFFKQLKHDFLKELPLYQFFESLKSISTIPNDNHTECESLNGSNELQKICYKLGNILGKITDINKLVDVDNNNRSCNYLNYFIQEEIENVKSDSNHLSSLYEAIKKYKSSYGNYECNFVPNTNTYTNIAKTINNVYYYAEYLYWIKEKFNNIKDTEENIFLKFLSTSIKPYDKLLKHDTCIENGKYHTELHKFRENYDEALKAIEKQYKDINPMPMLNVTEAKESCDIDSKKSQELEREGLKLFSRTSYSIKSYTPPRTLSDTGANHQDSNTKDSNDSTIGKATPIICSVVAISMFSFILHKFTPLGTYLRRNKLIDRNRMNEKQDDNYKLLSDASQIPHNIAYQPIGY